MVDKRSVSILCLESHVDDGELLQKVIETFGYKVKSVHSLTSFKQEIESKNYQCVCSGYALKSFQLSDALKLFRSLDNTSPFIIFSSTEEYQYASRLIDEGASYIVFRENPVMFPIVLDKALTQSALIQSMEQYQSELKDTKHIFESFINGLPDAVFLKDEEMRYMKVNELFSNHINLSESDIINKKNHQVLSEDQARIADKTDNRVLETGDTVTYELDRYDRKGVRRVTKVVKTPVKKANRVTGIVGVIRNITQQRELEERDKRYQQILKQAEALSKTGSFGYHSYLDIFSFSSNFKKLMHIDENANYSLENFLALVYKEDRSIFSTELRKAIEGNGEFYIQHRYTPKGTTEVKYSKTLLKPANSEMGKGFFYGTIIDITDDRRNAQAVLDVQERERTEMARELHDNVGQMLSAAAIFLNNVSQESDKLSKAKAILKEAITEIRQMSKSLAVAPVVEQGLTQAIYELVENVPFEGEMKVNVTIVDNQLSEVVAGNIYRICQEAINNMVKYSGASLGTIFIKQEEGLVDVLIEDNGVGFDQETVVYGNGLKNIHQRIHKCSGVYEYSTTPGTGVKIKFKVPIR
jgi:PAS domain S-box-containing protein